MIKKKFKVGQIVILKPVGDNARYIRNNAKDSNIMNHLEEYKVEKVGRKYVTVVQDGIYSALRFDMESNSQVDTCGCDWKLYTSIQSICDEDEANSIEWSLKLLFNSHGKLKLSLDQLRKINNIIVGVE